MIKPWNQCLGMILPRLFILWVVYSLKLILLTLVLVLMFAQAWGISRGRGPNIWLLGVIDQLHYYGGQVMDYLFFKRMTLTFYGQ